MTPGAAQRTRERGVALLIVLWALGGLALLGTAVTGMGRREAQAGIAERAAEVAHAAAEAALHRTMFDLLTGRRTVDAAVRPVVADGVKCQVLVSSEDGKVNPNTAPPELLAALLQGVGADRAQANAVAAAIVRWRGGALVQADALSAAQAQYRAAGLRWGPPGKPFRSSAELALVLGMTPTLHAALLPHVSVFPDGILDQAATDPVVRRALQRAGIAVTLPEEAAPHGPSVVTIDARVNRPGGGAARIVAVVRLDTGDPQHPATILQWQEPGRAD